MTAGVLHLSGPRPTDKAAKNNKDPGPLTTREQHLSPGLPTSRFLFHERQKVSCLRHSMHINSVQAQ